MVSSRLECVAQLGLLLGGEVRAQHCSTKGGHRRQHLVGRDAAHQNAEGSLAGGQGTGRVLHELVVDADVGPPSAPAPAPSAAPNSGLRNKSPISPPHNAPDAALTAVMFISWLSLTLPSACRTATTASPS